MLTQRDLAQFFLLAQRYFRDVHTASQHSIVAPRSLELIGQALLTRSGLDQATGRPLL